MTTGGRYSRELGGYAAMVNKHRNLGISVEQRRRFVETMSVAADDAGLPDDPEFRSALLAYLEWGTRLALQNSQRPYAKRRLLGVPPMSGTVLLVTAASRRLHS
jgi:truncated hemoglobin YjbI